MRFPDASCIANALLARIYAPLKRAHPDVNVRPDIEVQYRPSAEPGRDVKYASSIDNLASGVW